MYSEHTLQLHCLAHFKNMIPPDCVELNNALFAVPNGADVSQANRGRLKSEGLRNGWPDLGFCFQDGKVIWYELKRPTTYKWSQKLKRMVVDQKGGELSPEQILVHAMLRRMGHTVIMIDNVQDFATDITPRVWECVKFYRAYKKLEAEDAKQGG